MINTLFIHTYDTNNLIYEYNAGKLIITDNDIENIYITITKSLTISLTVLFKLYH